ncbi:MAG: NB-ARC domain-containing protein [Anaerolineae bacterium]
MTEINANLPSLEELRDQTYEALKDWTADPIFGSPLSHLALFEQARLDSNGNVRLATNRVLEAALNRLAVRHDREAELLRLRFLNQLPAHAVANRLHAAEATIYRWQNQALDLLAETLLDMERQVLQDRVTVLESRLEPPSYTRLFGVDEHRARLLDVLLPAEPPWLISVEGIGGIGKTSLVDAVMRAAIRQTLAGDIAWVSARQQRLDLGGRIRDLHTPALTTERLLEELAIQLLPGTPPFTSQAQAMAALRNRFSERPPIVVVDNLETVHDVETLLPLLRRLAGPAKFLLTTRQSLFAEADMFHFGVPELGLPDALQLIRQEATLRNLPQVAGAADAELSPIFETVGGNPLALRLVVGQVHVHPLDSILDDLQAARGRPIENLYSYIYRQAWDGLSELCRRALLAFPLVPEQGGDQALLAAISGLEQPHLRDALQELVSLNLVDGRGDLSQRRYTVHGLTRTFLMEQVARWQ